MNKNLLAKEVQTYLNGNLNTDVSRIALSKSPFAGVSSSELANQIIAKKKSERKLSTWFKQEGIIYPGTLSIEQTSSEETAAYKQRLVKGNSLLDISAGFGVDSYYFSKVLDEVYSCEINPNLSAISAHNAKLLEAKNIHFLAIDGLKYVRNSEKEFGVIYVDPARRNTKGKVFKLAECTPNVVEHLDLLLNKAKRIIIKTSPLLDIQAGLIELKHVSAIHILSVKNECKELLWIIDKDFIDETKIICATLNTSIKQIELPLYDEGNTQYLEFAPNMGYLYEADAALMKSGDFNAIANRFVLKKLGKQSHLYYSQELITSFIGRIFEIEALLTPNELKKGKGLEGNVIVRNFPEQAENLVKKFKIKQHKETFYIFTQLQLQYIVLKAKIVQYY